MSYDKMITEFRDCVNLCDPKAMQTLYWFLKHANGSQATTIPDKHMKTIGDFVDKFKADCECKDKFLYEGLSPELKAIFEHEKQMAKKK